MLARETIRLRGGRARQVYIGGSGPPLLWLHGLTGIVPDDPVVAALAARHRIFAPVAPGFADLDELAQIDNIHDLVLDYDDLLDTLDLAGVTIVGHSFGAMMAAEIAAHFPQRARALVLLSPVGLWRDDDPVADIFALPPAEMPRLLWHDAAARDAFAAHLAKTAEGQSLAEQMIGLACGLASITKFVWPIPDKGLRKRLPRIAAPTLIVFGAEDRFVPSRYAEDFRIALRQGEAATLAAAGHMAPYEKTNEVVALVEDFLRRIEKTS
jgi:pimeloyl-ACP methyl ester carboxylesterase